MPPEEGRIGIAWPVMKAEYAYALVASVVVSFSFRIP